MSNRKNPLLIARYWSLVAESMVRKQIKDPRNPGAERKELRARNEKRATSNQQPDHATKNPGL
jgi:hypothetical protein